MREYFRDDETPTTEDVKARWMHARRTYTYAQGEAQFDRWLADHDKEVAAQACASMLHEWRLHGSGDFYGWCTIWWQDAYRVADQNGDQ